ncbi:MAG: EF-P beta-lysylation protein EpmB [Gammaproteobacteria bacterium]
MSSSNTPILARDRSSSHTKDQQVASAKIRPSINKPSLSNWQLEYKTSITNVELLCQALGLEIEQLPISYHANKQFQLRAPQSYVKRMQHNNPNDPLLLQVLPTSNEETHVDGYLKDPVGDLQSIKSPGLLHKYNGRALLLATSRCAIHCRYCFRRHFPYSIQNPRSDSWAQTIQELQRDQSISEVILSGGDPLVLDDSELKKLIAKLEPIAHIKRLRIHTRLPVVIPNRINDELLNWISSTRLQIIMVLHVNHANEINTEMHERLQKLKDINCTLLNQSVLLKNINDQSTSLINLSESLFSAGVLPYYLHLLDKVEGAAHFDVSEDNAQTLMREISKHLPGYLVPKLVREIASEQSKSLISY